jgi:hypothetical protein
MKSGDLRAILKGKNHQSAIKIQPAKTECLSSNSPSKKLKCIKSTSQVGLLKKISDSSIGISSLEKKSFAKESTLSTKTVGSRSTYSHKHNNSSNQNHLNSSSQLAMLVNSKSQSKKGSLPKNIKLNSNLKKNKDKSDMHNKADEKKISFSFEPNDKNSEKKIDFNERIDSIQVKVKHY